MPHSNRKKKGSQRPKRAEVTDDDGWTHVTSTRPIRPFANLELEVGHNWSDRGAWTKIYVEEAPPSVTVETLTEQYKRAKEKFLQSSSWKKLQQDLRKNALHDELAVETCVCFGLGSPSAPRYQMDRRDVAVYQLACFLAIVDTLQSHRPDKKLRRFAQDPIFNSMDIQFLQSLSVTVVEDPVGFLHLTPASFAYAPGSEQRVTIRILHYDPAIFFGHELDPYMGQDGRWRCPSFGAHTYILDEDLDETESKLASPNKSNFDKHVEEYKQFNLPAGSRIIHRQPRRVQQIFHPEGTESYYDVGSGELLWTNDPELKVIRKKSAQAAATEPKDPELGPEDEQHPEDEESVLLDTPSDRLSIIRPGDTPPKSNTNEQQPQDLLTKSLPDSNNSDDSNDIEEESASDPGQTEDNTRSFPENPRGNNKSDDGPPFKLKLMPQPAERRDLHVADMVVAYLQDKGSIKMADFDEHPHAFYGNWVRYRVPRED